MTITLEIKPEVQAELAALHLAAAEPRVTACFLLAPTDLSSPQHTGKCIYLFLMEQLSAAHKFVHKLCAIR